MNHNPLVLGPAVDAADSSPTTTFGNGSPETTWNAQSVSHENSHENGTVGLAGVDNQQRPSFEHARTAPTTIPVQPVAHALNGTANEHDGSGYDNSPTPTLNSDVPDTIGGVHGRPLPGSHGTETDHGAVSQGHPGGAVLAEKAKKDLGLITPTDEKDHFDEKRFPVQSSPTSGRRIERTISGTQVPRGHTTTSGEQKITGVGMVPITRKISQPPVVGMFGGVAPSGPDAEEGLRPVRSHEEEEEREAARLAKGPDPWAVKFEPGDAANPKNWSVLYRWYLTGVAGLLVLNSTFASSSPSGIIREMMAYFGFSQEVAILTISLFVAGYCIGPLLWGPLSEAYGRRPIFILAFVVYTGFQVGCALSKNTGSILVFRFLGGCFAAAPLTNSGAVLADIWDTDHRGQAMSIFSLAPFAGPSIGPIIAGYISVSGTSWRWVYWILTMFAGFCLIVIIFTVPETYTPKLLVHKAKRLRKETGEERWYAPLERSDTSFKSRLESILLKPFVMLVQEPMLLAVTLYMSFVYGVVYLLFEAYPFVFEMNHGFNAGENGLAFLGILCGGASAVIFFMTVIEPRYLKHAAKVAPEMPKPEKRLELCIISAWCMVIAMFWFGWTSYSSIHWISPVLAGSLLGVGVLGMFVSCFNYLIDVYLWAAASALAATTVFRSAFGAAFPLFATQMYDKLGTQWASSLLGFIALLLAPIPIVLTIYGPTLRKMSKYSPNKQ